MSEQESHKLDETFRSMIERMSSEPPIANLDGMRANALQLHLGRLRTENGWLKAALGLSMLLLGSSGYLLLKGNPDTEKRQEPVVQNIRPVKQRDTVYITRTERVYIRVPIPESIDDSPGLVQKGVESPDSPLKDTKNSEPVLNEETVTLHPEIGVYKNKVPHSKAYPENKRSGNRKPNIVKNTPPDQIPSRRKQAGSTETNGQNQNIVSLSDGLETANALIGSNPNLPDLDFLEPLHYSIKPHLTIPKVHYKLSDRLTAKTVNPRLPISRRLSVSAFFSPELNNMRLRRDEIDAFEYGHEKITETQVAGLRVGIKLSDKLSLLTGIEYQTIRFEHAGLKKETLIAQNINGQPTFFKKTVFGSAQIPGDFYTSNPTVGSRIVIEGDEDNFVQYLRIPMALKYDFYSRKLPWLQQRSMGLKLYALVGGYWAAPARQQMKTEIYEPNGHDFYTTLTHFQNTKAHFGFNAGLGAEICYGKHWLVFGEPYYQTNTGSMVQNLPLRTFVDGFGCRFGVTYQLK